MAFGFFEPSKGQTPESIRRQREVARAMAIPEITDLPETYFVHLELFRDGQSVSRNFY